MSNQKRPICLWIGFIIAFILCIYIEPAHAKPPQGMILIPAGEFTMGSEYGEEDEVPVHQVHLDAFYIDKYEVTNAKYRQFLKTTNHRKPYGWEDKNFNRDNQPVVGVSWEDAIVYCEWAAKRLPTEAEWEKAARGEDELMFPWGPNWHKQNANSADAGKKKTVSVGSHPQGISPYGVHDMAGNVWEGCADWYVSNYYLISPKSNPPGPVTSNARVIRGGGWFDSPAQLRTSNRYYSHPMVRYNSIGFRCAKGYK